MTQERFLNLKRTAGRLGVPVSYLRRESEADRVPYIVVGRQRMFSVEAVERAILERADKQGPSA